MGRFSIWELLIVLLIVALLFGTKKLRNIGGDLGSAIKSFRNSIRDGEDKSAANEDPTKQGAVIEGESKTRPDSDQKSS